MLTRDDLIDLIIDAVRRQLPAASGMFPMADHGEHTSQRPVAPPQVLTAAPSRPAPESAKQNKEKPGQRGRLFLSEYDIRKRLTPGGRRLTIPKDAIISPLATDWLVLQGIEIVRE